MSPGNKLIGPQDELFRVEQVSCPTGGTFDDRRQYLQFSTQAWLLRHMLWGRFPKAARQVGLPADAADPTIPLPVAVLRECQDAAGGVRKRNAAGAAENGMAGTWRSASEHAQVIQSDLDSSPA